MIVHYCHSAHFINNNNNNEPPNSLILMIQNMYKQYGGAADSRHSQGYYNPAAQGSTLASQDQTMLNLVSHSLGSKQLYRFNVPHHQPGS